MQERAWPTALQDRARENGSMRRDKYVLRLDVIARRAAHAGNLPVRDRLHITRWDQEKSLLRRSTIGFHQPTEKIPFGCGAARSPHAAASCSVTARRGRQSESGRPITGRQSKGAAPKGLFLGLLRKQRVQEVMTDRKARTHAVERSLCAIVFKTPAMAE